MVMFKWVLQGLPGWHSGWGISLANAGVMGLIPGPGSRATESVSQNYWAQALEATAMRSPCTTMKTCPHSPQLEKAQSSTPKNKVKVAQLWPTLCDLMGSLVHGLLQSRILEWVAFSFSRGSSQSRDWTQVSCTAGGFLTSWATREAQNQSINKF